MITVLTNFIDRVEAKDLEGAEAALEKVRDASTAGEWSDKDLSQEENERLVDAVLEFSRLERCGPVIDEVDDLIETIHDALDLGDADLARSRMKAFQGSQASGGPWPSYTGKHRLIEAFRRKEWEL